MKLLFAPEALEDLENIYRYYAEHNEQYAVDLHNHIISEAEFLQNFPFTGQKEQLLEEYPEDYRSLVVRHCYKIVYFIENDTINIVSVFNCRQDPQRLEKNIRKI